MAATTSSACGALARWLTTTRCPCSARTSAVAAPIPRLAPVIIATRAIRVGPRSAPPTANAYGYLRRYLGPHVHRRGNFWDQHIPDAIRPECPLRWRHD